MIILFTILTAILCGVLYRMGGAEGYNTRWRDAGCSLTCVLWLTIVNGWNWWLIPCFGAMWGMLTTYWKKKGTDATFFNYAMHGLGIAGAMIFYAFATQHFLGFGIRCLVLPPLIALWATKMNRPILWWRADVVSEWGRGFFILITTPLLLV